MNVKNARLRIGGMTCINCQHKIKYQLMNTAGVLEAAVSYNTGLADITYDSDVITRKEIEKVIERLDYQVLKGAGQPETDLGRTVAFLVIIVSLYALLQQSGVLNLLAPSQLADSKMGYGMLFIIGVLTSVHCIAMCGGINLSQCIPRGEAADGAESRFSVLRPAFLYNLGRVISYTAIGFVLGAAGSLFGGGAETGLPILYQGILKMIAGAYMIIMGINMLGLVPGLRRFQLRLPKSLTAGIVRKKAAGGQPLLIGLLNGLMPCGPLQSMQIVALASGNAFAGALSMLLFSLGTVPLMLGLGSLVSVLGKKFAKKVMSIGSVLVVVLGLAMLSQGGSLSGFLLPDRLFALVLILCALGIAASIPFRSSLYRTAAVTAVLAAAVGLGFGWHCLTEKGAWNVSYADAAEAETAETGLTDAEVTEDGVQVIHSTLSAGRYPNITVQVNVPVKWVIDAPPGSITGCNYKMLLTEYGITHTFSEGENIIEFTPEKTGTVQYTCWMGMLRGNIFVTDQTTASAASDGQTAANGQQSADSQQSADVPVPAGYQIPSDELAVAQITEDESGTDVQKVAVDLTEDGFYPAVVVVEAGIPVIWSVNNTMTGAENGTELLVPVYASKLTLSAGENNLYLYPQESFELSTGDHRFYAYVKVVDDLEQADETEIREEVDAFETMIYPDVIFAAASSGGSCCD